MVPLDTVLHGLGERTTPAAFADLCDTLVWKFTDNGAELHDLAAVWASGDDPSRARAAALITAPPTPVPGDGTVFPPLPATPFPDVLLGLRDRMDLEDFTSTCDALLWTVSESEVLTTARTWLGSDDPHRIEAALAVNDGLLYATRSSLAEALTALTTRHPGYAPRAAQILTTYDDHTRPRTLHDATTGRWTPQALADLYLQPVPTIEHWLRTHSRRTD
ncbi:hypothetical protein [Actinomadura flavalba]|uniref:hypothetical protein n=1 Tax=Actinomadura flavalba TaxID=1120938 RepID=UPI0012DD9FD4|nr:hypothetical protein [Actinomadura flavalba]